MEIEPMKRDVRKLKMGDTFFIECRFVSADKHAVSVLIGNDYGHPIKLRANMGELAYLYENTQTIQDQQQMQIMLQSIGDYNKCCCAELRKETQQ